MPGGSLVALVIGCRYWGKCMSALLKNNFLPILISAGALVLVTIVGLIPIYQQADPQASQNPETDAMAALIERIEALEGNAAKPDSVMADIPANAGNARLRQEIDLINKGLANQTGRVSRIKKRLETVVDEQGQAIPSSRAMDEIALIKRALVNLTKRLNKVGEQLDSLQTASTDIGRLQQQMANADRAFIRLAAASREQKQQAEAIAESLAEQKRHAGAIAALLREEKRRRDAMAVVLADVQKSQGDAAQDYADMKRLREVLSGILQTLPE